ncbi:hypothetical protein AB0G85_38020 [Streptomyces sioyaensis]
MTPVAAALAVLRGRRIADLVEERPQLSAEERPSVWATRPSPTAVH